MKFIFRRYNNIRKMDSTYIKEYGYNGKPVSQSASQSISLSLTDRLTVINDLFPFKRLTNMRKINSTYITEFG